MPPVVPFLHPGISLTELYTIGIGPSSSHTVGPMRAAAAFAREILRHPVRAVRVGCDLYGSLALTGLGHGTDGAVLLGLAGWQPETVDPDAVPGFLAGSRAQGALPLGRGAGDGGYPVAFVEKDDLRFHPDRFEPGHPNAMDLTARFADGSTLVQRYYSIGGGAIRREGEQAETADIVVPYPFASAAELLEKAEAAGIGLGALVCRNEEAWRTPAETQAFLDGVHAAMSACIDRGMTREGVLPGGLNVRRRAKDLHAALLARIERGAPVQAMRWVSLWALAVNEENAGGGRVVTAPTNGAAGVIPAVLRYFETFEGGSDREAIRTFLATAAAIGMLYKTRASISAAEMGCQGEVGVACSMAAAGLTAVLGGSNAQIENAAEIGMEHNLGLTCDPIGGLVQVPCIERNTMGAIKAINAAYLALDGDGRHIVSLDQVIETMRQTGEDMRAKYKETSLGGLAVNVVAC
ncbi:L-serine ammonia-lyase [Sphingomonas oleivorans]|uniref:L-serine ammonia-lyase n=1 Tax=Sphingomonas oleivorans TaxID=1735121 RepID=UPI001FAF0437|nr:L-serine ammonia-lyase [Sphingomonas oleivorans]